VALQKTISTRYGIDATYWKIERLELDWLNSNCFCRISGWKDNASRLVPDAALDLRVYNWSGADFTFSHALNNTAEAYGKIKAITGWEGAIDV